MKCPNCGAENDPANRFCDQCGTKLDAVVAAEPAVATQPVAAAAATTTCPNCGAAVLPGEAFCDECGTPLSAAPVVTDAAADAPTTTAVPAVATTTEPSASRVVCPACGHRNEPGSQFCENCGASLEGVSVTVPGDDQPKETIETAPEGLTEPPAVDASGAFADEHAPAADELFPAPATTQPSPEVEVPISSDTTVEAPPAEAAPAEAQPVEATPVAPAETAQAAPDQANNDAERQRLTDEIARQDQVIAQFEQMQTMFGANAPAAVTQGLQDARAAREQAETALQALPTAPTIDPAEVARLNDEIARQEQIIAQFEQMQTMFGANVPAAVTQGLQDARSARDAAAAELQTLTGGTAAPAAPVAAQTATPEAAPAAPEPAPVPAPAPAAPQLRLVVESSGTEIPLALDKSELIIGREDPISGIFPEVDLTAHGGESGGVSRQHAKLVNTGGQWSVVDLNSTNYTRVDGSKLDPNTPAPVRDGSRIQLGRVVLLFKG